MTMSVDYRKIEQVTQFMGFVEALADPAALKAVLADLKKASDDLKDKLGVYSSLEKVHALEQEVAKKYKEMSDKFEADALARSAALASAEVAMKTRQAQQASTEAAFALDAKQVREKQAELAEREKIIAAVEQNTRATWAAVDAKAKDLAEVEAKLSVKTEQLKKLLGE